MASDNEGLHLTHHQWKVPKLVFQVNYLTRWVFETMQTGGRMVTEFSSALGMIFHHALFQIQMKLKSIFAEINFRKKKWLICGSYNLHNSNISNHLHHLGKGLDNYIGNYDNILLFGDFNSEFSEPCLKVFCDIYNLKSLEKEPTCYKKP